MIGGGVECGPNAVLALARGDQAAELKRLEPVHPAIRAAVLETAADYLSWRFYARRIKQAELDRRTDPLLARRVRGDETGGWEEVVPGIAAYWQGVRRRIWAEFALMACVWALLVGMTVAQWRSWPWFGLLLAGVVLCLFDRKPESA